MRGLMCTTVLLVACGTEQEDPDWVFNVTVSNQAEDCSAVDGFVDDPTTGTVKLADLCFCEDEDGTDCGDEINGSKETFTYELFFDGDSVAIEIDGQPFASGTVLGCELEYESPTWREETPEGEVLWSVSSRYVQADGASVCPIPGQFQFLGVEDYVVVESENEAYPQGRTVRKVISGYSKAIGGE